MRLEGRRCDTQLFFGSLAFGNVLYHGNEIILAAIGTQHQRHGKVDPHSFSALVKVPFLHRIGWYFSGQHLAHVAKIGIKVIRVGDILKSELKQLLARVSHDVA